MAIIKHLKRLDDTVRGASKTMVAAFDKDGNIIAGKRPVLNIPPVPTNANVGKVWTATNAAEAGWRDIPKTGVDITEQMILNPALTITYLKVIKTDFAVFGWVRIKNDSETQLPNPVIFTAPEGVRPTILTYSDQFSAGYLSCDTNGEVTYIGTLSTSANPHGTFFYPLI